MPEHLKALVVILALAAVAFALARAPATAVASLDKDFKRRRNVWFAVTLVAFLAHNFWLYILAAGPLLYFAASREHNKLALYYMVLFAVPAITAEIPGFGIVNYLFSIHYLRLLSLVVLLPAYFYLRRQSHAEPFGRLLPDKLLLGYLALAFVLQVQAGTFTNSLRFGVFYAFTDVFLPYYVASRSLRTLQEFRDALGAFVVAALVLALVAMFEFGKQWLLYSALEEALNARWGYGEYLTRGGRLRAAASAGHSLPLAYVLAVACGLFLYIMRSVPTGTARAAGLLLLGGGLVATLSRGPWVGAAFIVLMFVATGPGAVLRLAQLAGIGALCLPLALVSPVGDTIINHLPFVGQLETDNITYRQRLLEISLSVFMQNPWFGSSNYMQSPAMQSLMQGQGIIDMVNTYLSIALFSGGVGLSLFVGFFAAVLFRLYGAMRRLPAHDETHLLGQGLVAVLLGILLMIFTFASITVIPYVYWSLAGMGVAYARVFAGAPAAVVQGRSDLRMPVPTPARRAR